MENDARHLEPYFYSDFPYEGKFDLPVIKRQQVFLDNLKLIRYSSTVAHEYDEADATVHFFEYDDRFDEVWRKPSSYIARLSQYRQVIAPDFSMYTNMALALQVFNTYRNRWLGAFWQSKGLAVIPSVSWSDEWSFEFCFDAIQPGSVVALSTIGCAEVKDAFMLGYSEMCKTIDPSIVICYGTPFAEMESHADILEVSYQRNARIAPAKASES